MLETIRKPNKAALTITVAPRVYTPGYVMSQHRLHLARPPQEGCLGQDDASHKQTRQPNVLVLGDLRRLLGQTASKDKGGGDPRQNPGGSPWELQAPNVIGASFDAPREVYIISDYFSRPCCRSAGTRFSVEDVVTRGWVGGVRRVDDVARALDKTRPLCSAHAQKGRLP